MQSSRVLWPSEWNLHPAPKIIRVRVLLTFVCEKLSELLFAVEGEQK